MSLPRDSSRVKTFAALSAVLLVATSMTAAMVVMPSYAAAVGLDAGVVVPLYNTPDSTWTTVAQAAEAYPNVPIVVIVNPDSGPGSSESSSFLSGIQSLQAAGVTVIGYVWSDYAGASLSSLESQISQYKSWYEVNGIFFDGMSNSASTSSYYSSLNSYVMSDGMTYTMGNPGASVPDSMLGIFTTTNVYENPGFPTLAEITYAGYPTSEISFMAYGVTYSASFVVSAAPLAGYMYIDNQGGSNPYATLSSYFAETVSALAALDGSATSSSTNSSTTSTTTSTSPTSTTSTSTTTTTSGGSGIALTGTGSTAGTVSSSPYQITLANFNAGTGSDRLLVVGVSANDENVASITFGGTPLTAAGASFYNNDAELWYLVAPSGSASIVVTMAGSTSAVVGAYAFAGVSQTEPVPTVATAHDTAAGSPAISITTAYPESWVLDLPSIWGGSTLGSPTCTSEWDVNVAGAVTGASSSIVASAPGQETCGWTASPADLWDDVAAEIQAANTTTTTTTSTSSSTTTTITSTSTSTSTTTSTTTTTTTTKTTSSTSTSSTTTSKTRTSSLKISSKNTAGATITGFYTDLFSQSGAVVGTGYTPVTYTVNDGQTYTVQADGYGSCQFAKWQDNGSTNPVRSIAITSNTSLVAVYNCSTTITTASTTSTTTSTIVQTRG